MKENKVNPFLGKLLKELREEKLKMSYRKFAKSIGVSISTIYRWETGECSPHLDLSTIKALLVLMRDAGLDPIDDLPDDLAS